MLDRSDLHDNQNVGIRHLHDHARSALFMPMGGGKTVTTLTALDDLSSVEDVWPALVLAPLRVAKSVWPQEPPLWQHLKHLKVIDLTGTTPERNAALKRKGHIYTLNPENMDWLLQAVGGVENWPFPTVVCDELTRWKSFRLRQGGKRARALGSVAHTKVKRFIGLTGTPSPNGLIDLWGQVWFMDQGQRLGRTFSAFEQRWFAKGYDGFSLKPMAHAEREIQDKLRDICLTVEGLQVDEPIVNNIMVDLPPAARRLYAQMEKDMFAEIGANGIEAFNAAARTSKLLQLSAGAVISDSDSGAWEPVHDAKLDALESVIEEAAGAPVLVAYNFRSDLARIQKRFPKAVQLGSDPKIIDCWNAGGIPILLAHPACLHPKTEVLTEYRGWVKIVDVERDERVFDGVEFVSHRGCSFSGVRPVINVFGITLTPNHKLLIGQEWVKAKDVRDCESVRESARYAYRGAESRLSAMLPLRRGTRDAFAERGKSQSKQGEELPDVPRRGIPSDDRHAVLSNLERDGGSSHRSEQSGLQALWRVWARNLRRMVAIQNLLRGHVRRLSRQTNHRTHRQFEGVFQGQLSLGNQHGTAVQQEQQSTHTVFESGYAPCRILSSGPGHEGCDQRSTELGNECGGSVGGLREIDISKGSKIEMSSVYDLVDCGPRSRFLIRNSDGEVFISHNSAGHGINLARGGNILVFFSLDWNLETYMQIIERLGPMRQKQAGLNRPVFVHHILSRGTLDESVLERLSSKKSVQTVLLEAMRRV